MEFKFTFGAPGNATTRDGTGRRCEGPVHSGRCAVPAALRDVTPQPRSDTRTQAGFRGDVMGAL